MNLMRCRILLIGLSAWLGLGGAASCSSEDHALKGGRVEHPAEPGSSVGPSLTKASPFPTSVAAPSASAAETPAPSEDRPPSPSEELEKRLGIKLSPLNKTIMDDCPARAWSKNVPQRRCTKDDQCGDGFCDRDRCAPLFSCRALYSRACERNDHCAGYLCIDGRCRSCTSDEECAHTASWQSDPKCESVDDIPNARECFGVVGGHGP
jgi:hypothetical protein